MKKILVLITCLMLATTMFVGCGNDNVSKGGSDTLTFVWYPNESGNDLKSARAEFAKIIEEATGKKVEHKLTTDYAVAIETLVNGNAHISWLGAQGYVEANKKNKNIEPIFVPSGKSGTLDDAVYYSWLAIKKGDESKFKENGDYSLDNLEGKKFSFVSTSSTSGFKVPSAGIVSHFSKKDEWKDLEAEDLLEGGDGKIFSEVLFGGSHQGSAVNLLAGKVDVAAFCDTCVSNYTEFVKGNENRLGALYKVKDNAEDPFSSLGGEEFKLMSVTPVLNAPFVMNTEVLSEDDQRAIIDAFTSESVKNNEKIFVPEGSDFTGLFNKKGDLQFLQVEDSWFDPIRELSK